MLSEQISLNGTPSEGFGEPWSSKWIKKHQIPVFGVVLGTVGAVSGGFLLKKSPIVGAALGALVGGVVGGHLDTRGRDCDVRENKKCDADSWSESERNTIYAKAKANIEASGIPFDNTWLSDEKKLEAFMAEVYRVAGCPPP